MRVDFGEGIQTRHNASRFQQSLVLEMTRPEPESPHGERNGPCQCPLSSRTG